MIVKNKIISLVVISSLVINSVSPSMVLAVESPESPELPDAVESPETPDLPESPDPVNFEDEPTPTPEPEPTIPTLEQIIEEMDDQEEESNETDESDDDGEGSSNDTTTTTQTSTQEATDQDDSDQDNDFQQTEELNEVEDGQVGDPYIETGDITNSAAIINDANNNFSEEDETGTEGITIINEDNGSDSENTASIKLANTDITEQDNTIVVDNNLDQSSNTGNNSASSNVGDSTIETGDANTTGTIINSVNTNVDGVSVNEFNVVDDHVGDVLLEFAAPLCGSGCAGDDLVIENTQNGEDSENNLDIEIDENEITFQTNDADIENNMTLASNTGENIADGNVGNSTIETGDANVSANVLNLANNNFAGEVYYSVVNIFGQLIGDIQLPDFGDEGDCCSNDVNVANTGNGEGSSNNLLVYDSSSDQIYQFNDVVMDNNIIFDTNTGGNEVSRNTDGNNTIDTGDINSEVNVVNVANNNLIGGNWWLVIVNGAENWLGNILGADEGSTVFGSNIFDYSEDENGELNIENANNGSDSENNIAIDRDQNSVTVQDNKAKITNNLDLSANTGDNSASRNTGGDSEIKTGDASIVANVVNFVNNNVIGNAKLYVNVVNVFGSWIGDFISPGQSKDESEYLSESAGIGGVGETSTNSSGNEDGNDSDSSLESSGSEDKVAGDSETKLKVSTSTKITQVGGQVFAEVNEENNVEPESEDQVLGVSDNVQRIEINLAWGLMLIPLAIFIFIIKKRSYLLSLLPSKSGS